nr:hypothetical protein [Tanacetum cinerariifolium]
PPQNCPKCGNPVDGHYCQGCALLRKKFKEDLFTYCIENGIFQNFQDTFESSNDNTNAVNALQEPFVFKQDPCKNSSQSPSQINHHCWYGCGESLEDIICHHCTCEFCRKGAHYGYNCPPKVPVVSNPEPCHNQNVDELPQTLTNFHLTCYSRDEDSFVLDSTSNIVHDSPNDFNPHLQPPTYSYAFYGNAAYYGHDCPLQYGDEHLDTISETESDELIKSSVEDLVPIPRESEGIPDNMCDVPFHDNSPPLDISKDQFEDFSDSNDDSTSINDDSFSIDDIEYVEASPPDSKIVSLEVMEIVIPEKGGIDADILLTIKDDIIREKLLNINLFIANIEALKDNPTPYSDFMTKSSSTSFNFLLEETNTFDNSLPESKTFCFDLEEISSGSTTTRSDISLLDYEAFYDDHVKEISSGNTTTHSDFSLYDSFIFDLSINLFPPADRSDFYHEEFADELAHIISPPEYDCFCFKNEPNSGDFTMDVVEDTFPTREPRVHVHNVLPTHPTLQLNLEFIISSESLFAYVVWIFLSFLSYSVTPQYLLSFKNEDTIFDPGISICHSFMPDVSQQSPFNGGNCLSCSSVGSENEFVYDPNPYSYNETPNFYNQHPQHQYETNSCEFCGNDAHYGYHCPPRIPIYYDDDDDEESSTLLRDIIIYELPSCIAITPDLSITDSLIMEDEHLDTISETESDKLIKSSVENLVLTQVNPMVYPRIYLRIYPILKIDSLLEEFFGELAHINLIPSRINEADFDHEKEIHLVEKLLYDNSSPRLPEEFNSENSDAIIESFSPSPILVEDSDSLMEKINLFLTPDDSMPPGIENDDHDSEEDIIFLEELLSNYSPPLPDNESFYFDVPSSPHPLAKQPDDNEIEPDTGLLTTKVVGDISKHYVLMPRLLPTQPTLCLVVDTLLPFSCKNEDKVHLLSHRGFKAFQLFSESLMMIYGENIPNLDVPFYGRHETNEVALILNLRSEGDDLGGGLSSNLTFKDSSILMVYLFRIIYALLLGNGYDKIRTKTKQNGQNQALEGKEREKSKPKCMQTRYSSKFVSGSSSNPISTNLKHRNRIRSKPRVKPFSISIVTMADNRTMEEMLQAPTEGYGDAIVADARIDKLTDTISNLIETLNQKMTTLAMVKAVEETCVICGGAHTYYDCIATDGNILSVYATTGTYNQGNIRFRPPVATNYRASPPGFPPVQNVQNRFNQNQNQGNFQAPNHQAPNTRERGQNFNQGSNNFQAPNFQALNFQVGPSNELTTYMKSNEAILRDMRTQMTNMKTKLQNEFKSTIDARTNKIETQNNQIIKGFSRTIATYFLKCSVLVRELFCST